MITINGDPELYRSRARLLIFVPFLGLAACTIEQRAVIGDLDARYQLGLRRLVQDSPDYSGAFESLRSAAINGHVEAQKQLGRLYASVRPQPDLVRAYLWLHLAAVRDEEAMRDRDQLALSMNAEQVNLAQMLATQFVLGEAPDLSVGAPTSSLQDLEFSAAATHEPEEGGAEQASIFFVQVGAFKSRENAARFASQLSERGYPAKVVLPASGKEGFSQVTVGPYESHDDAQAAGKQMAAEVGSKGYIVEDSR